MRAKLRLPSIGTTHWPIPFAQYNFWVDNYDYQAEISFEQDATALHRVGSCGGAHPCGRRRAKRPSPRQPAHSGDRRRGTALPRGIAASPAFGVALPGSVADADRSRRARHLHVRRWAHAHGVRRPAPDEIAALSGQGRTSVRISLGGQRPHVGAAARAAGHLRAEGDSGPDQRRTSRRPPRGRTAARGGRCAARRARMAFLPEDERCGRFLNGAHGFMWA